MEHPMHKVLFENPEMLQLILVQIVTPNLACSPSDLGQFEDDMVDFMLAEFEGSNSGS
jgi:Cse1